jgi:Ala-tRNA(Pro) deacylase
MALPRLQEYLQSHRVAFDTLAHPYALTAQETAASAHVPSTEMAKTVMVKVDDTLAMAVIPANEWLDLGSLKELAGAESVRLATEAEFRDRFPECEVGAMPPFGNLYGMDVYAADSLATENKVAFNAGTHRELVRMDCGDFHRLVHPQVGHVTRH